MENPIQIWLLVLTLFIPRISLLIAYLWHQIPANTIPFIGDIIMYVLIPRVLMLIYIADNLGTSSPWFWIHLVVTLIVWSKSSHWTYKRKRRRRE
jgi:hypothetical protein